MLVKCGVCGAHVPAEIAVDLPGALEQFCSLRCGLEAESTGGALELPALPLRILVAVDGSGPSLRAARFAAALAQQSGGSLTLLHAVDPALMRGPQHPSAGVDAASIERALRADAEAQLERCRRLCQGAGVPMALRIEVEVPARAVSAAAAGADLVVMGSRGLGAISGQTVGSLSQRVLAETRTPVLVIH